MNRKLPTDKILKTCIILLLSAIIGMIVITINESQKINDTAKRVLHKQEVLFYAQKVPGLAVDNETGTRGYTITGNKTFLAPLEKSQKEISNTLAVLKALTSDHAVQQTRIDSLSLYIDKRIAFSNNSINAYDLKAAPAAIAMVETGKGKFYTDRISFFVDKIQITENALMEHYKLANDQAARWLNKMRIAQYCSSLNFLLINTVPL